MTLGVMEDFIFLPQNFFEKMSNFDLSRGYLMGGENVEQVRKKWTIKKQTSRDRFYSIMGGLNYVKIIQIYK